MKLCISCEYDMTMFSLGFQRTVLLGGASPQEEMRRPGITAFKEYAPYYAHNLRPLVHYTKVSLIKVHA